jgi:hypothetical protein
MAFATPPGGVRIEHRYPDSLRFLSEHDGAAVAVLHDLLAHAKRRGGVLVVEASVREIAGRLEFVSKDTVHRRLRQLIRAEVVRRLAGSAGARLAQRTYVLDLDDTGITLAGTSDDHSR